MWLPLLWCSVAELPEEWFVSWSGSRDGKCSYCVHLPRDDTPGECSEIPVLGVCMCVSGGKREAQLCHGYSGPMDLGGFSLESILMRKKESHTYMSGRSLKEQRLGCQDPLGWHKEGDTSLKRDTCLCWGDCHRLQSWLWQPRLSLAGGSPKSPLDSLPSQNLFRVPQVLPFGPS